LNRQSIDDDAASYTCNASAHGIPATTATTTSNCNWGIQHGQRVRGTSAPSAGAGSSKNTLSLASYTTTATTCKNTCTLVGIAIATSSSYTARLS